MLIFGLITGLVLGALLMNLALEEEQDKNKKLNNKIDILEEELDRANFKIENRDNLISYLKEKIEKLKNKKELAMTDNQMN